MHVLYRGSLMPEVLDFSCWMRRVRAGGDAGRAAELVHAGHERHIRGIAIRVRLTDPTLRRQLDTMDICQSVLHSFFARAAVGQYNLSNPEQLIALLVRMAANKLAVQVRHHRRQRRDGRRSQQGMESLATVADAQPGPERQAAGRELLDALLNALAPDERELAWRRSVGQTWAEIAQDMKGTPAAHRMKLRRGIDRVAPALGDRAPTLRRVDDGGKPESGLATVGRERT